MSNDDELKQAMEDYILDSQIMLEVPEEFVIEIFTAGAKWQRKKLIPNPSNVTVFS